MADRVAELARGVAEIAGAETTLERPSDPTHGDYATNVAMKLAGQRKQPPRAIAEGLAGAATALEGVARAEVAGPGFLNLFLSDGWMASALDSVLAAGESFGAGRPPTPERVQVEMVSANPTGPLTVGSARNGAYGDSVARLLAFAGHAVSREYYYNDSGSQMDRFRASVDAVRNGMPVPADGYHGEYLDELAAQPSDPVELMLERIEQTLQRFRIHFDSFAKQSTLEQRLPEILPRLDTYEQDGALFVRSTGYGDEKDRVLIRSPDRGGLPTYEAADVAYLVDKMERGFDRAIYVLGADHHGVRGWYAVVAKMLGYDPDHVEVLLYQLVHLTRGGAATKMSKRSGDVVLLDELMDEIGVDATRWYLVSRGHDQTIEIDVDLAAEKTSKNPVFYVQYAHARIAGILRNADAAAPSAELVAPLEEEERALVKRLLEFPAIAAEAAARRAPHAIPTYAIRVADDFHRFYKRCKVVGSEQQSFRLGLCLATKNVVARCLDLVGVEAPDRM